MKQKTLEQWLNTLPTPLRVSALSVTQKNRNFRATSLAQALMYMGPWASTPEGQEFWQGFKWMVSWAETGREDLLHNVPGEPFATAKQAARKILYKNNLMHSRDSLFIRADHKIDDVLAAMIEFKHLEI